MSKRSSSQKETMGLKRTSEFAHNGLLQMKPFQRRVRVMCVGEEGSGKSSLLKSLITGNTQTVDKPSANLTAIEYYPFHHQHNVELLERDLTDAETDTALELWDMPGRKIYKGLHPYFYAVGSLLVLTFNLVDEAATHIVSTLINTIQSKVPGWEVMLVGTRADKLYTDDERRHRARRVLAALTQQQHKCINSYKEEISQLSKLRADSKILERIEWLENLLQNQLKLPSRVHIVSCLTGKGIDEFKRSLFTKILNRGTFTHLSYNPSPQDVQVISDLIIIRSQGTVLITFEDLRIIAQQHTCFHSLEAFDELYGFLMSTGLLHALYQFEKDGQLIIHLCILPSALAATFCEMHVEDSKKSFRLESKKFWPKRHKNSRPDPDELVKLFEEIPQKGLVREALLPLLWKDLAVDETEIQRIVDLLQIMGLMMPKSSMLNSKTTTPGFPIPLFQNLSLSHSYYLPLTRLLDTPRPQLNWTQKPHEGDYQINWRYHLGSSLPPGLMTVLMTSCRQSCNKDSYCYCWKDGILLRINEAIVCMNVEEQQFTICCRINPDDLERSDPVEVLWPLMSTFILRAEDFLNNWPGLYRKVSVAAYGADFFKGTVVHSDHYFSLYECWSALKTGTHLTFVESGVEHNLDVDRLFPFDVMESGSLRAWLRKTISRQNDVMLLQLSPPASPPTVKFSCNNTLTTKPIISLESAVRKKSLEIKWSLDDAQPKKPPQKAVATVQNGHANMIRQQSSESVFSITKNSVWGIEQEDREMTKVATSFVATVMATAVADYIGSIYEDNHGYSQVVSAAQVAAARATADAVCAVRSEDPHKAARAVKETAVTIQRLIDTSRRRNPEKSKLCLIL